MLIIFNTIAFALISHIIGQYKSITRALPISIAFAIIALQHLNLGVIAAYMALFTIVRLLPTQSLFSAVHGKPPGREDGRWQFLQTITIEIDRVLCDRISNKEWYCFGITYGFVRTFLAFPAMVIIGGYSWLLLGQGAIYFLGGYIARKLGLGDKGMTDSVMYSEMVIGALFGACL